MTSKLPPLAEVLDLVPDAVCVVDPEGRFLFVSAAFERIFGYAPAEVIGRRTFELVHPDDREATLRQAEQVMGGTLQRHFRNRYLHKDGHTVDIQWSARWLPEYRVRVAVGHEVTELRRAEPADRAVQLVGPGREHPAVDLRPAMGEDLRDFVEREARGATEGDQRQPLQHSGIEHAPQSLPPDRGDEPLGLVVAQRRRGDA